MIPSIFLFLSCTCWVGWMGPADKSWYVLFWFGFFFFSFTCSTSNLNKNITKWLWPDHNPNPNQKTIIHLIPNYMGYRLASFIFHGPPPLVRYIAACQPWFSNLETRLTNTTLQLSNKRKIGWVKRVNFKEKIKHLMEWMGGFNGLHWNRKKTTNEALPRMANLERIQSIQKSLPCS